MVANVSVAFENCGGCDRSMLPDDNDIKTKDLFEAVGLNCAWDANKRSSNTIGRIDCRVSLALHLTWGNHAIMLCEKFTILD